MIPPERSRIWLLALRRAGWVIAALAALFWADDRVRSVSQDLQVPSIRLAMEVITWFGKIPVVIAISLGLFGAGLALKRLRLRQAGGWGLVAVMGTVGLTSLLKHLIGRPRPSIVDSGAAAWGPSFEDGYSSFPSGHASLTFTLAAVLASYYPTWRGVWYGIAGLVAISRIYLDLHFASDIMAGAVLGLIVAWGVLRIRKGSDG